MPKHSLIIPHKGRAKHLAFCVASIHSSANLCGIPSDDYEILVVGEQCGLSMEHFWIPCDDVPPVNLRPNEPAPFWKTRYLNMGIAAAEGDVLTFLDADAIVGPHFMENIARLDDESLTKLCYRVRYTTAIEWDNYGTNWGLAFGSYNDLPGCGLAFEAYGSAECDHRQQMESEMPVHWSPEMFKEQAARRGRKRIFGNSQFSITRKKLGDVRPDERYFGRGWEDIDFNKRIAARHGSEYRAEIVTDGQHALFHIRHEFTPGYGSDRWNRRNTRLFFGSKSTWVFATSHRALELIKDRTPGAQYFLDVERQYVESEMLPGDAIIEASAREVAE